ncbi:SMI1/KNR4 family protein [Streptomyces sp. NPDC050636]|uniref:SMI1/KNR4 family protein n=1 Tax=Streptomyces sp. NPDC050636 TaxID=3154510 RepID=UPI00344981B5
MDAVQPEQCHRSPGSDESHTGPAPEIHTDTEALRAVFAPGRGNPPLGWAAVRTFESGHGITLPEPYRTFVAEIADGCADGPPDYGLVPLAALPDDWSDESVERALDAPFPLTAAWLWEDDPRPSEKIEPLLAPVAAHGSVVLGTDGCGMYWHLIVTGEHRGHIWQITGEGAVPFGAPFGLTTAEPGFAGWVRHWAAEKEWYDVA